MNPGLSMSISKSMQRQTTGGGAPVSSRIFLEHSLRETTYTLISQILLNRCEKITGIL